MRTDFKYYLLFALLVGIINPTFCQTYEEFKKSEQEKLSQFKVQQSKGIEKLANEFDDFVRQADKDFIGYLQREWKEYEAFQGIKIPQRPKPVEIPKHKTDKITKQLPVRELTLLRPITKPASIADKPILPIIQKIDDADFLKSGMGFNYYGTSLFLDFDDDLSKIAIQDINERGIGNWWSQCSKTNYNQLVNQLLDTKNKLSLNDWAYFLLVKKTSESIIKKDKNNASLLMWFLMIRSGYEVKVAFDNTDINLLITSANEVYGNKFLIIDNKRYYFVDEILTNTFQTYDFSFSGATRVIDFNIYQPLNIGNDVLVKQIKFDFKQKEYSFPVTININTLYLLKDYPITELSVFFNASMSEVTKQTLAEGLLPIIHNMSNEEAINFLLAFVQKSFQYQTDKQQFDKEKFFFPEELFYYPASDCEDRSVLFAYLVKQLLHLEVIGLEYADHVATAVKTNNRTNGDYVIFNNDKYIIADPTYVNAPLGLTMPQFKNKKAKVIETNNSSYLANLTKNYWEITNQWGGTRGNNLSDSKYDSNGNCYLTGYYTQNVNYGSLNWKSPSGNRQAFIAKYNKERELIWARNIETNDVATAFSLTLDKSEHPVIAGSFKGEIYADGQKLVSKNDKDDIFVAAYSSIGDLKWFKKSGLDTISYNDHMNYAVKFNENGDYLKTKIYFGNASTTSNGIFYSDNSFTIIGGINNTTGFNMNTISFDAASEFNTISYLKETSDALIQNNVNKSIAGLFAVITLIKSSGMVIPGQEVQTALNKYNPSFRTSCPSIYENIGKVTFMKNEAGIISVKTHNNKPVSFGKIKINTGAKIKITSMQNGNEQIDILSGVEVGKAFVWFDLNFVRMNRVSGNLLFDYDNDNTQKIMNMKVDILD